MSEQKEKNMPEEKLPEAKLPESAPVSEGEALTALADAILATDEPEEIADVPEDDELEPTHGARGKKEKPEDTQKSREERLSNLIEKGKKAGKLTLKEIADVIDGLNLSQEQMDRFYDTLEELNIETVGEDLPPIDDDELLPALDELEEIDEVTEEEIAEADSMVDSYSTDDPVRMYLKEIGKVPSVEKVSASASVSAAISSSVTSSISCSSSSAGRASSSSGGSMSSPAVSMPRSSSLS